MSVTKLLLILIVVALIADGESWRRRRRRRCVRRNCVTSWGPWSSCNCLGKRTRTLRIISQPACGGAACPNLITQIGKCITGFCIKGAGHCDVHTKRCDCEPGRTGARCERLCPVGTYGKNCAQRCNCVVGTCHASTGHCICPIGRSGKRCQHSYSTCLLRRYHCFPMKPILVQYNQCFLLVNVASTRHSAYSRCPTKTHYARTCLCYKNLIPVTLYKSHTCRCQRKTPISSRTPSTLWGKYISRAICCPRHPFV